VFHALKVINIYDGISTSIGKGVLDQWVPSAVSSQTYPSTATIERLWSKRAFQIELRFVA
jgi:hypothetical protein